MYGSVRSEFTRQKSQNSTSTGRPTCLSIRRGATLIQESSRGNGGAGIVSGWARTGGHGSIARRSDLAREEGRVDLWSRLDVVQSRWNVLAHPFYERWAAGRLTRGDLARFAGQYRHAVVALAKAADRAAHAADPAA